VSAHQVWTLDQVRALGVSTDLITAGSVLGIGRTTSYHLARTGTFPIPILRVGNRYTVAVAHLLKAIGVQD
jgi:hypothetical protein